jgi:polysaccharide export outer membrane protein
MLPVFSIFFAPTPLFLAFMPTSFFRRLLQLGLVCLPALLLFSSCASNRYYNQRTMFRLTDRNGNKLDSTKLRVAVNRTARNYVIQPNDFLDVRVYTNKGERILDPNGELQFGTPTTIGAATGGRAAGGGVVGGNRGGQRAPVGQGTSGTPSATEFLVQADGTVTLPMVNRVRVSGYSLLQADSVLKASYEEFYKDVFVTTRVTNNRVFILGAPGGQVISLTNDNMNLLEVLALAGGIDGGTGGGGGVGGGIYRYGGKASDIRIIRGDLKNPQVQQIDLTTLEGMRRANLQMEPNDVIYIDPVRRPFLEAITDAAPAIALFQLALTITFLFLPRVR